MADNGSSNNNRDYDIFNGNDRFSNRVSGITQVTVEGIADKALQGINTALARMNSTLGSIRNSIDEGNDDADLEREATDRDKARDERNNRARYNALFGNINKVTSGLDVLKSMLKESLGKILNLVKNGFNKALSSYDDFAKQMRLLKVSTADKKAAELKADEAFLTARDMGFHVNKSDMQDFLLSLVDQPEFNSLTDAQLALAGQLKSSGFDNEAILEMFRQFGNDTESIKKIALRSTDRSIIQATNSLFKELIGSTEGYAIAQKKYGGDVAKMAVAIQEQVKAVTAATGGQIKPDQIANLIKTANLADSGRVDAITQGDTTGYMMAMMKGLQSGSADQIAAEFARQAELIKNDDEAYKQIMNQLTVLGSPESSDTDKELAKQLSAMYQSMRSGNFKGGTVDTKKWDESLAQRNAQNTPSGHLDQFIQTGLSKLNVFLGGSISDLSVTMDEYFGDSVGLGDITDVVKVGFSGVINMLKSIRMTSLLSGGGGGLAKGLMSGIGGALKGAAKFLFNPMTLAVGAAVGSVAFAYNKISDTYEKLEAVDNARDELKYVNSKLASAEKSLEMAKKTNASKEEIVKLEAKVASLKADQAKAQSGVQTAEENAKTGSEKAADEFSKKKDKEMLGYIQDANEAQRNALRARAAGDIQAYEEEMKRHDDLIKKADSVREEMRVVDEESHSLLASMFDLSPETMKGYHEWKENWGKTFDDIGETVSGVYNSCVDVAAGYIQKGAEWLDSAGTQISDGWKNFKANASSAWDTVAGWFSSAGESISSGWDSFKSTLSGGWNSITSWWNDLSWDDITNSISSGWDSVKNWWNDLSWDDITNSISEGWDDFSSKLSDGWNDFKTGLSDGWESFKSLFFAEGGIVDKPTPAVIGEAGKELVLPLTNQTRMNELLNQLSPAERDSLLRAFGSEDIANNGKLAESLNKLNSSNEWYGDLDGDVETTMFDSIGDMFSSAFDSIGDIFSSTTDSISDSISSLFGFDKESSNIEESLDTNVSKILETLVNVNKTIDSIFGIEQKVELESRNNSFSAYATGGVVTKPTRSIIGENGKEVILPLTDESNLLNTVRSLSDSEKQIVLKALLGSGLSKTLFDTLTPSVDVSQDGLIEAANQLARGNINRVNLDEEFDVNKIADFGLDKNIELASDLSGIVSETLRRVAQQYAMAASKIVDDDEGNKDEIYNSLNTIIRYLSQIAASNKKQIVATKPIPAPYK